MTGWLSLGLLFALGLSGCPHKAATAHLQADPWSEGSLERYQRDVLGQVERQAQRTFTEPPVVALTDSDAFAIMMVEEQRRLYERVLADTPLSIREEMAQGAAEAVGRGILGKYGSTDGVVYLCADAIASGMAHAGLAPERTADVASLILAHELTHLLTDQHTDLLGIIDELPDREGLSAASAVWEGLATLVAQRVAAELGLSDVFDALTRLQGWGPDGLEEPAAHDTWALYGRGRDFLEHHEQLGGMDRVWEIAARPPRDTATIFRPSRYGHREAPSKIDYAGVLRGTDQFLTRGDWVVANTRLGELALRGEATLAGEDEALDQILDHLIAAHQLDLQRPDRSGAIRLMVFTEPKWPAAYLELLRAQETDTSQRTAASLDVAVEVRYEPLPAVPGDLTAARVERVPIGGGRHHERRGAWVVRGNTLVVIDAEGFRPGLRLGRTFDAVFASLDGAREAATPAP